MYNSIPLRHKQRVQLDTPSTHKQRIQLDTPNIHKQRVQLDTPNTHKQRVQLDTPSTHKQRIQLDTPIANIHKQRVQLDTGSAPLSGICFFPKKQGSVNRVTEDLFLLQRRQETETKKDESHFSSCQKLRQARNSTCSRGNVNLLSLLVQKGESLGKLGLTLKFH